MRSKVVRLTVTLVLGALFGLSVHKGHEKWRRLGRTAFLAHESQRFDKYMAGPSSKEVQIFTFMFSSPAGLRSV